MCIQILEKISYMREIFFYGVSSFNIPGLYDITVLMMMSLLFMFILFLLIIYRQNDC